MRKQISLRENFDCRVSPEPNTGCWLWAGSYHPTGYGQFGRLKAHRLAYEFYCGNIPEGHSVLHRCAVPACVNPEHLFTGVQIDNMRDMIAKGRGAKGLTHGRTKLTEAQVRDIRAAKGLHKEIASQFGIARRTVGKIKHRQKWSHLP